MEWYRIKQVAEKTGLSEQLIRKWEQRYGAVEPRRLGNGYRMYNSEDVNRLLSIKRIVDSGTSVSQAVESVSQSQIAAQSQSGPQTPVRQESLLPQQAMPRQQSLLPQHALPRQQSGFGQPSLLPQQVNETIDDGQGQGHVHGPDSGTQPAHAPEWVNMLIDAGTKGRIRDMKQILHRCYVMTGFRIMVTEVIVPFLQIVGMLWEEGSWSEDQEHLSSLSVRDFLVQRMADLPDAPDGAPMLLASCIPGERHDIMLNIAMLEAKRLGFATAFLGTEPAPGAIERAVQRLHPTVLLLSATSDRPFASHPEFKQWLLTLDHFAQSLPETRFCFGGPKPIVELCAKGLNHIHPLESLTHLFAELEQICGVEVS